MYVSDPDFFRIWVIIAVLREEDTEPETNEEWIILVINEDRDGRQALTEQVGSGSSWQVVVLDFQI